MSSYCYEAVDAGGLKTQGTLDVTDQSEALRRIKEMGLFPTKVAQPTPFRRRQRKAFAVPKMLKLQVRMPGGRIKPAVLAVFTRQLATLIEVGMPLMRGLRILQEQTENHALKRVITDVAAAIEGGGTLSEALAAHPRVFSPLYVNMVKAGEMAGVLEVVLRRQAEFMEKALKIKGKIKAVVGTICRKVVLSRFARTLGTLLGSGVPILQALTIVKETAGNVTVGGVISKIHDSVKEGGSIAGPLKESRIFPAMVSGMVDVGEQTGALPDMLMKIADTSDEEVDNAVSAMTSLLEPVMIIFLAIVVGSIVIAMFLPIIELIGGDGIGGGPGAGGGT